MKASASASFTLKLTAAQTQSAEVKDSREDTCFSQPKALETVGGLWFFQEWDGLKWAFLKKKERKILSCSPTPTKHAKQERKGDSSATWRRWFLPWSGASQCRQSLGPASPAPPPSAETHLGDTSELLLESVYLLHVWVWDWSHMEGTCRKCTAIVFCL